MAQRFLRLAQLAPKFTGAELKILINLTATGNLTVTTTNGAIAAATGLADSAIRRAIHNLANDSYITYRPGKNGRHEANIDLALMRTVEISTPPFLGGVSLNSTAATPPKIGGPPKTGAPISGGAPPFLGGVTTENKELPPAAAAVSIKSDLDLLIDQVLNAKEPNNADAAQSAAHYLRAHLVEVAGFPDAPAPDPQVIAQFLECGRWPGELYSLLKDLRRENKKPERPQYFWFVVVALQKLHDIPPGRVKERREQLAAERKLLQRLQQPEQRRAAGGGMKRIGDLLR